MADGRIKIAIEVDGKQVDVAANSLDGLGSSAKNAGKWSKDVANGLKEAGNESTKADTGIKKFVTSLGLVAIGAKAFKVLSAAMGDAISRFDTLNKFPKVLQSLGVSAEDSEKSISRLSKGIDGLPTKLNDIASNAQRMYTSFGDMDKATDSALALNNALLGSGSSAADAQRGTEQYLKVLQTGKMELDTWNTLSETMDVALVKVAEGFGYAGRSAKQDLYGALKSGSITIDQFNDKLVELGTGTGELADLARKNSLGMATSLENLKGAFSRGLANILESLNKLSKDTTGKELAEHIDSLKVVVNAAFKAMARAIEAATPFVKGFVSAVQATIPVVKALSPVIIGLVAAYAAFTIIDKVRTSMEKANAIFKVAQASKTGLTLVTKAHTVAMATDLKMTQADTMAMIAQTGAVKLGALAMGVMTGQIGLLTAAKVIATAVTYALKVALSVLMGPIGLVVAGIGLLVAGGIALVKWLKKETEESKRLTGETEKLGEATNKLSDDVESTSEAYKDSQKETIAQGKANKALAGEIENLAKKENKSASEKMILRDKIEQLNGAVDGLNLAYDEEANALSMSNEQLQGRVGLMATQTSYNNALERQLEIEKQQHEVAMQLEETNALREDWNQKLEDGSVKSREHKKAIEELDAQEALLTETNLALGEQHVATELQVAQSAENMALAIEEGNLRQIISYETLSDEQKATFDSMKTVYDELAENATNAFERMNNESKVTGQEMIDNLEYNQEMTRQWGENIAELYNRAGKASIDDGFIKYLENLGVDSAAEVAEVTKMSDPELKRYSELMAQGGEVAGDSFKKALGNEFDEAVDSMIKTVDNGSKSLREQIKNSGFDKIGSLMPEGTAQGIKDGTPKVENASREMAKGAESAAKKAAEINSPSRVFTKIGKNMTEGLALGISDGITSVTRSAKDAISGSVREFGSLNTELYNIGTSAMDGLNNGLNARRNMVMNTARSIANQVANTMKSALKIHSPSKVMEDDVGRWIPAGLANGIERFAPTAYKAMDFMSNKMLSVSSPEQALGIAGAGSVSSSYFFNNYAGRGSQIQSIAKKDISDAIKQGMRESDLSVYVQSQVVSVLDEKEVGYSVAPYVEAKSNFDNSRRDRMGGIRNV